VGIRNRWELGFSYYFPEIENNRVQMGRQVEMGRPEWNGGGGNNRRGPSRHL